VTHFSPTTNPNAARGDSWCRRYTAGPHLIPVPADAPLAVAEPLPQWLKRSKPLTPADDPRMPAEVASERHPGLLRLARGLQALLDETARQGDGLRNSRLLEKAERVTAILEVPARTPRRPTLASVAKQANRAAIAVVRYEVKPDGTVVVVTGAPPPIEANPWDEVLSNAADKKRPS
jgi:hypothetical protein